MFYTSLLVLALGLVGCSKGFEDSLTHAVDETNNRINGTDQPQTLAVDPTDALNYTQKSDLPVCNADHDKQVAFTEQDGQYFYCVAKEWVAVHVKGHKVEDNTVASKTVTSAVAQSEQVPGINGNSNQVIMISNSTVGNISN